MKNEQSFAEEIADSYVRMGWEVEDPEEALPLLRFRPDILLRRGDQHLVIEIKKPGVASERSISEMRKIVEAQPNWRLEVKLLPPRREHPTYRSADAEAWDRLELANELVDAGRYSDAFLLIWVVIEASLHRLSSSSDEEQRPRAISELFRSAYEAGGISDPELRQLQRGLELRNQTVHGYAPQFADGDARLFLSLARALTERAGAAKESQKVVYVFQCSNNTKRYGATHRKQEPTSRQLDVAAENGIFTAK